MFEPFMPSTHTLVAAAQDTPPSINPSYSCCLRTPPAVPTLLAHSCTTVREEQHAAPWRKALQRAARTASKHAVLHPRNARRCSTHRRSMQRCSARCYRVQSGAEQLRCPHMVSLFPRCTPPPALPVPPSITAARRSSRRQ